MTVKSKKRRLKRAHVHQALAKGRDQFHDAFSNSMVIGGRPGEPPVGTLKLPTTDDFSKMTPLGDSIQGMYKTEIPSRAKCPTCGFSQKVRKNGTMSRHDVFVGSDPTQCEGSGKPWQ